MDRGMSRALARWALDCAGVARLLRFGRDRDGVGDAQIPDTAPLNLMCCQVGRRGSGRDRSSSRDGCSCIAPTQRPFVPSRDLPPKSVAR